MGKKSKEIDKKRKKDKAREFNAQYETLSSNKSLTEIDSTAFIPADAAINPLIKEKLDDSDHFILIFDDYNDNECQLKDLDRSLARSLIRKFKTITACNPEKLPSSNLIKSNIHRDGQYNSLYSNLSPDIELQETELSDKGRVFFGNYPLTTSFILDTMDVLRRIHALHHQTLSISIWHR